MEPIRVTVWSEFRHEKKNPVVASIYPEGMHGAIAGALRKEGFSVRTATLDEPDHGLTDESHRHCAKRGRSPRGARPVHHSSTSAAGPSGAWGNSRATAGAQRSGGGCHGRSRPWAMS